MNPLAQREKKKKKKKKKERKISGVLFFIMENRICAMVASFGLWSGFLSSRHFTCSGCIPPLLAACEGGGSALHVLC